MKPQVRELGGDDAPALREFFAQMPSEDRTFFHYDVDDPTVIDNWACDERQIRRCAVADDGAIRAIASLVPGTDWSSHVAELILLVSPAARRQGLGRTMARTMLIEALQGGFKKVWVQIASDNVGAIEMFHKLGFEGEALFRDQLRNPEDGELRDTVILAHLADEQWATMVTGGFEEAVA